jgi:hypothetical protein
MRRLTIPFLVALSLVLISTLVPGQAPAAGRVTVYKGARLILGSPSAPRGPQEQAPGHGAHLHAGRCEGVAPGRA